MWDSELLRCRGVVDRRGWRDIRIIEGLGGMIFERVLGERIDRVDRVFVVVEIIIINW